MALHHVSIFTEKFDSEEKIPREVLLNDFLFDYTERLTEDQIIASLRHMYRNITRVHIVRET